MLKLVFLFLALSRAMLITEIMCNPRDYNSYFEFIELYNEDISPIDMSGWQLEPVAFTIPKGTILNPGQYLVVSCNTMRLLQAYNIPNNTIVLGDFNHSTNALSNSGETITLVDTSATIQATVDYSTSAPWPKPADGFGSSLELSCYDSTVQNEPTSWSASPMPEDPDTHVEYAGSPGAPSFWLTCAPSLPYVANIIFSEIMYNPITQIDYADVFEFIEIYNNGTTTEDLSDWRIATSGTMRYRFPVGTTIPPGGLITIAHNISAFYMAYPDAVGTVLGPYVGDLSNNGEKLLLVDTNGLQADYINWNTGYSNSWPVAANGFGASYSDLPTNSPFYINYAQYQYKGQSLSRRSLTWSTNSAYNWAAKDPSPNVPNLDDSSILLPVIHSIDIPRIYDNSTSVPITVSCSPWPIEGLLISSVIVHYWTYNAITVTSSNYGTLSLSQDLTDDPTGATWIGNFDIQPANTIRRYNVTVTFSTGQVINSPAIIDPFRWWSYFVEPYPPYPNITTYHMFINPNDWGTIYNNVNNAAGNQRVNGTDGCFIRTAYGAEVPSILVLDGLVMENHVRLQGSRWNRENGQNIPASAWNYNRPANNGGVLRGWSYRFTIPNYFPISGSDTIILDKLWQGCTMYETPLSNTLNMAAGIAAASHYFVRFNAQGEFLRYMAYITHGDGKGYLPDALNILNPQCIQQTKEVPGNFFKDTGADVSEGPWGYGDWSVFPVNCPTVINPVGGVNPPWAPITRYEYTYDRETYRSFGTHAAMEEMINAFNNVSCPSTASRATIDSFLDMNLFLNYLTILNFAGTWDQKFQNQFAQQRITDYQWSWHPWDSDELFGEAWGWVATTSAVSLYAGNTTEYHYLKNCVIQCFTPELNNRFRLLLATILAPSYTQPILDAAYAAFDQNQANLSPGGWGQNFPQCYSNIRSWLLWRYTNITATLGVWNTATEGDPWVAFQNYFCPEKPNVTRIYTYYNFKATPGRPPAPEISSISYDSMVLQLYPPNTNGYPLEKYTYRYSNSSNGPWSDPQDIYPASNRRSLSSTSASSLTAYTVTGLDGGSPYYFQTNALTSSGTSDWSDPTPVVNTAPAPPPPPPAIPTAPVSPPSAPTSIPNAPVFPPSAPSAIPTNPVSPTSAPTAIPTNPASPTVPSNNVPQPSPPNDNNNSSGISTDTSDYLGPLPIWAVGVIAGGGALLIIIIIIIVVAVRAKNPEIV